MPIINEDELKREITSKNLASVYLIFGEDSFLKSHYTSQMIKKTDIGDPFFNLQRFEDDADLQSVYDAVNQFPMMADKKIVILTDYPYATASKSDFERLCALVGDVPQGCVFILKFDGVEFDQKSAAGKKLMSATEKGGGRVVELGSRNRAQLKKMLCDGAKKRGCALTDRTADYILDVVGDDINTLRNELDKLCFFKSGNEIDKDTVDLVCTKSVEASIFDYSTKIIAGDIDGAMRLLDDMFYMHFEAMGILYNAAGAFVDMYRMFTALKVGKKQEDVANDFAYPPNKRFLLKKAEANLKKMDTNKFNLCFDALVEADKQLKSFGVDERSVLERLTVRLVYIIVKGESVD